MMTFLLSFLLTDSKIPILKCYHCINDYDVYAHMYLGVCKMLSFFFYWMLHHDIFTRNIKFKVFLKKNHNFSLSLSLLCPNTFCLIYTSLICVLLLSNIVVNVCLCGESNVRVRQSLIQFSCHYPKISDHRMPALTGPNQVFWRAM